MINARPGAIFEASLENAATGLAGTVGVQIIDTPVGTILLARTTAGIAEQPAGSGLYHVALTAPEALGTYTVVWDTGGSTPVYAEEELVVSGFSYPTSTFATVDDVQLACGGDHSEAEIAYMLDAATALILMVIGKDLDWLANPDTVIPSHFRYLTVSLVCRGFANPGGSQATREQLGEYSYSQSFSTEGSGLWLTALERMLIRNAVYGRRSATARPDSLLTTFYPEPT